MRKFKLTANNLLILIISLVVGVGYADRDGRCW